MLKKVINTSPPFGGTAASHPSLGVYYITCFDISQDNFCAFDEKKYLMSKAKDKVGQPQW